MLKKGALVNLRDKNVKTTMDYAKEKGDFEIIQLLEVYDSKK
ncbi:MAG: hypothetical protein DRJ10_03540 [Bacteroidetes bacterium]|nr:MAG: hypothetical protein DRJ10_03540 [Bacteroidota bacterium]